MANKDFDTPEDMELALTILMGYCEMASETIETLKQARDKLAAAHEEMKGFGNGQSA